MRLVVLYKEEGGRYRSQFLTTLQLNILLISIQKAEYYRRPLLTVMCAALTTETDWSSGGDFQTFLSRGDTAQESAHIW